MPSLSAYPHTCFLLPWMWGISSWLLQQSAAAAPYLGRGVAPLNHASFVAQTELLGDIHIQGREGSGEEIPLVQGKEQWLRFAGAAVKRYPIPKVRETQVRG